MYIVNSLVYLFINTYHAGLRLINQIWFVSKELFAKAEWLHRDPQSVNGLRWSESFMETRHVYWLSVVHSVVCSSLKRFEEYQNQNESDRIIESSRKGQIGMSKRFVYHCVSLFDSESRVGSSAKLFQPLPGARLSRRFFLFWSDSYWMTQANPWPKSFYLKFSIWNPCWRIEKLTCLKIGEILKSTSTTGYGWIQIIWCSRTWRCLLKGHGLFEKHLKKQVIIIGYRDKIGELSIVDVCWCVFLLWNWPLWACGPWVCCRMLSKAIPLALSRMGKRSNS